MLASRHLLKYTMAFRCFSTTNNSKNRYRDMDHYQVLGVSKEATQDKIKKKYIRFLKFSYIELAKKHHPDIQEGSSELFKEISEAYNILSNPEEKR